MELGQNCILQRNTISSTPSVYLYLACVLCSAVNYLETGTKLWPIQALPPLQLHIQQIINLQDFLNCCHFWRLKQLIRKDIITFMPWYILQNWNNTNTDVIQEDVKLLAANMHHTTYLSNSWQQIPQRCMPFIPHIKNKTGYLFTHCLKQRKGVM